MNIRKVSSIGLIGTAMMTGVLSSCVESKYEDKAKAQAVKYLTGDELLKAERFAHKQTNYDSYNGDAIVYWDSLVTDAKVKEAYVKGQQLVRDRANNVFNREEKFKASIDTILPTNVIEESMNEYSKYSTAKDFISARNNAPEAYKVQFYNDKVAATHYWNLITLAGKQKEAYQKGIADEKAKISEQNKQDSEIKNTPDVSTAINAYNFNVTRNVIETNAAIDVYNNINK